jgi:GTP-binding protein HflX
VKDGDCLAVAFGRRLRTIEQPSGVDASLESRELFVHEVERAKSLADESGVLVRVILPDQPFDDDEPLAELEGLATTAGLNIVGTLTQRRQKPDAGTYIGRGKVEELEMFVEQVGADVVLFDNDLSPGQTRNLEQALKVKVLDRTELILDIFATHAQTLESRLAVELAQLEYSLPRLKRMWTHLSRYNMGIGMRGPGEKQLEIDRRLVEKRIVDLRAELKQVEQRKERLVRSREAHMTVSLVGYTNAGKSTLMNAFTDSDVLAEDKLFATLDTRTRRWHLPNWGPVLLSDTVGFIRDLPHRLVASFKATLEEARQANLLIHVADVSNPAVLDQISAVYDVLEELDIDATATLLVLNKMDAPGAEGRFEKAKSRYPNAVAISAKSRTGLEGLRAAVSEALSRGFQDIDVTTGVGNGKLFAYLSEKGEVLSQTYVGAEVTVHCRLPQKYLGRLLTQFPEAEVHRRPSTTSPTSRDDTKGDLGGDSDSVEEVA